MALEAQILLQFVGASKDYWISFGHTVLGGH
jgi:hypothetical protein